MKFDVSKIIKDCLECNGLAINLDHKYPTGHTLHLLYFAICEYLKKNGLNDFKVSLINHRREIFIYHHSIYVIFIADSYDRIRSYSIERRKYIDEYLIDEEEHENEEN